jgi:hypothetical protein
VKRNAKCATRSRTVLAHAVLLLLKEEAAIERRSEPIDDDLPRIPQVDCLASPQSRRAAIVEVNK